VYIRAGLHRLHPKIQKDNFLGYFCNLKNDGGADEGCVVLRVRLAALHRAVRE